MGKRGRRRAADAHRLAQRPSPADATSSGLGAAQPSSQALTSWPKPDGRMAPVQPPSSLLDLERAALARCELDQLIRQLVDDLVAQGATWGDIGRALGITRQGARQRFL